MPPGSEGVRSRPGGRVADGDGAVLRGRDEHSPVAAEDEPVHRGRQTQSRQRRGVGQARWPGPRRRRRRWRERARGGGRRPSGRGRCGRAAWARRTRPGRSQTRTVAAPHLDAGEERPSGRRRARDADARMRRRAGQREGPRTIRCRATTAAACRGITGDERASVRGDVERRHLVGVAGIGSRDRSQTSTDRSRLAAATRAPSRLTVSPIRPLVARSRLVTRWPRRTSHSMAHRVEPAETRVRSAANRTAVTAEVCPRRVATCRPSCASQTYTPRTLSAGGDQRAVGTHRDGVQPRPCGRCAPASRVATSHTTTRPSSPAESSSRPSGLKATSRLCRRARSSSRTSRPSATLHSSTR